MKIAISAMEPGLDSDVDPRFGRSQHFILIEPETMQYEAFRNPYVEQSSGAGISTAQLICNKGVGTVITGKIGPKAHQVLSAAGVCMLTGVSGKVCDAIERYKAGNLSREAASGAAPAIGGGGAMGRNMRAGGGGGGMGTGSGMGRGMGRGMGGGGGKGMGGGGGGGKGMGMGAGRSGDARLRDWEAEPWSEKGIKPNDPDELALLKQQANRLADELTRIRQRIEQMESR